MGTGRMMSGAWHNDRPVDGYIRNLRVEPGSYNTAIFDFAHEGVSDDQKHRYLVLLDGDLVDVLDPGSTLGQLTGLDTEEHELSIVTLRDSTRGILDQHGNDYGKRAYILWDRSTDSDVASYAVYYDAGGGTVDYNTALEVIDSIGVQRRDRVSPDSGSGTGRISVIGEWLGTTVNVQAQVKVTGSGTAQWKTTGSWSSNFTFERGSSIVIEDGIKITFHDDLADYVTNDTWNYFIGPENFYLSAVLDEGTYKFDVKASDAAGNESSAMGVRTVVIIHPPGSATSIEAAYDSDSNEIDITWSDPADGDLSKILIYSNYSNVFDELQDYIIEEAPYAEVNPGVESYTISAPVDGTWMFYVRTQDTSGRINKDITFLQIVLPQLPSDVKLATPAFLRATPIAGGKIQLKWLYDKAIGGDITEWHIFENTSSSSPSFASPAYTVAYTEGSSVQVDEHTWETPSAIGGTRYYTVRASDGTNETLNTDLTTAVPDSTAPTVSGDVHGTSS